MSKDLLVVGLDLTTGREVHVNDQPLEHWHRKAATGDRSLVCLFCYQGWDRAEPATVPVVVKGRIGGRRRAHFAHPPHQAPRGGHGPETRWHAEAKQLIAAWARGLLQVEDVSVEQLLDGNTRRSDVQVRLRDGALVAIELQQQTLTDAAWLARHRDYVAAGVVDVWLWHPATGVPHIVYSQELPGWTLDLTSSRIGVLYAEEPGQGSWWPPRPGDEISSLLAPISDFELGAAGLKLPDGLQARINVPAPDPQIEPDPPPDQKPALAPNTPQTSHHLAGQAAAAEPAISGRADQALLETQSVDARTDQAAARPRPMLFPAGRRPRRLVFTLVSPPGWAHRIYRPDALPPFANAPEPARYVCWTCGLILTSVEDHHSPTVRSIG
ncbi:competence protein CoiA-like protein [Kribbella amoyensis]|uniref:Competence protein CoiA-like protein n=1 Tax=Kribbella amoyensis TaxID=996641 RepID=A0A561BRZ6_9ACTN|nr:competence protein CoiA family protein [Kribbella amoyensis]TWD81667.1 competence protein CoiA-like protein [Kribbella amoyensis]